MPGGRASHCDGLDPPAVRGWAPAGRDALEAAPARRSTRSTSIPVPDGDTGTNLYLTLRRPRPRRVEPRCPTTPDAARDAAPRWPTAPCRRPGQLRRDPRPAAARLRRRLAEDAGGRGADLRAGAARGRRGGLRRRWPSRSRARADRAARAAAAAPYRRRRRRPGRGGARRRPRAARGGAAPARPSSSTCCARAGVVDAGGAGCASCSTRSAAVVTGGAARPTARDRVPAADRARIVAGRPRCPESGVRGDVPARRRRRGGRRAARGRSTRSATPSSWSAASGLWNVHVHVDDVGAAVEAGDRGRPPAPDPGHPLRRRGRPPGRPRPRRAAVVGRGRATGSRRCSRGRRHGRAPATRARRRRSTARCWPRIRAPGGDVVVLPNDADSLAVATAAADEARERRASRVA